MKIHNIVGGIGLLVAMATHPALGEVINFDELSLAANSFYNGGPVTNSAGWTSGSATFGNSYSSDFGGYWNGFSYSNVNDIADGSFTNQYAAFTGTAFSGSIYAVGYSGSQDFINLPSGDLPGSVRVTNTTYAALDMTNGSGFSKKFGGATGNDPDWFMVTFTGYSLPGATGSQTGTAVDFYLADYRFADNAQDYIVNTWQQVDLSPLGNATSIGLSWGSSDVGGFGINTPTYVALDNLTIAPVPEPGTWVLVGVAGVAVLAMRRRIRRKR